MLVIFRVVPVPAPTESVFGKQFIRQILMGYHMRQSRIPLNIVIGIGMLPFRRTGGLGNVRVLLRVYINRSAIRMIRQISAPGDYAVAEGRCVILIDRRGI